MLEKKIRDFNKKVYTKEEFFQQLNDHKSKGYEIFIGTDSQVIGEKVMIASCIGFYRQDLGCGKIFYVKDRERKQDYPTLKARMTLEAYRSIELAMDISEEVEAKITIHLDIGTGKKNKTAFLVKELSSFVSGQDFGVEIKPSAWMASCVADKIVKH